MRSRLVPELLRQRDYRLIWSAHTGSVVGDGLHAIAITWLTFSTLGAGAPGLAALGIALVIPSLALGILSGTLVDRWDRRRVMVYADVARAAIAGLLALSVVAGFVSLPIVIVAGIGMILASTFFGPAQSAVLPAYVASDQIVPANAMLSTSRQAAALLTPAIGSLLFDSIGPTGLLLIDAASFLWSAYLVAQLTPGPALPGPAPRRPLLQEAGDGLRFIANHPPSRLVTLVAAGNQLFASGPFRTVIPLWVNVQLGGGVVEYGIIMSGLAAGLLVANIAMSFVRARLPLVAIVVGGVFVQGAIWGAFAFASTLALATLAFFLLGAANGVLNAANSARLQLTVPSELRGRTFATFFTTMNLTTPLSLAVTGTLATLVSPVAIIAGSGLGMMVVGSAGFMAALRQMRQEAAGNTGT
jgi:MFS family permease